MNKQLFVLLCFALSISHTKAASVAEEEVIPSILGKSITCIHPTSGYATDDIGASEIYSNNALGVKGPLQVTQIHTYDPALHPVVAFRIAKEQSVLPDFLAAYRDKNFHVSVVIDRPVYDAAQQQCLRPHYVAYPTATTTSNISQTKQILVHDGTAVKMTGSHNVHVHDNVCSPSNMHMAWLDLSDDNRAYTMMSVVETGSEECAITFHYVPTKQTYEGMMALLTQEESPIATVKDLLSKVLLLSITDATDEGADVACGSMSKILGLFGKDLTSLT
jgi:hypothetical protein